MDAQHADLHRLAANIHGRQLKNTGFVVELGWVLSVYRGADRGAGAGTTLFLDIENHCGKITVICNT